MRLCSDFVGIDDFRDRSNIIPSALSLAPDSCRRPVGVAMPMSFRRACSVMEFYMISIMVVKIEPVGPRQEGSS